VISLQAQKHQFSGKRFASRSDSSRALNRPAVLTSYISENGKLSILVFNWNIAR
jgi:hypothetical protein